MADRKFTAKIGQDLDVWIVHKGRSHLVSLSARGVFHNNRSAETDEVEVQEVRMEHLIQEIEERFGIPKEEQKLVYRGKSLRLDDFCLHALPGVSNNPIGLHKRTGVQWIGDEAIMEMKSYQLNQVAQLTHEAERLFSRVWAMQQANSHGVPLNVSPRECAGAMDRLDEQCTVAFEYMDMFGVCSLETSEVVKDQLRRERKMGINLIKEVEKILKKCRLMRSSAFESANGKGSFDLE